jgi:hypothetical protein
MTWHGVLVFAHVLLLVYWLGTDLGVFYSARYVLQPNLPPATRGTIARILLALDLSPRICLVLMLPVGMSLAASMGVSPVTGGWLAAVWIASLVWLTLVVTLYRGEHLPAAAVLRQVDLAVRVLLVATLLGTAIASLAGAGPFATTWLPWKIIAYAIAIACGVAIRVVLRPFGPALAALLSDGSTPEVEAALARSLRGTYPFVLTIWAMLLIAAFLGAVQP